MHIAFSNYEHNLIKYNLIRQLISFLNKLSIPNSCWVSILARVLSELSLEAGLIYFGMNIIISRCKIVDSKTLLARIYRIED